MKEPYEKGIAIHSAPSFAVGAVKPPLKRKQGERWAGYNAGLHQISRTAMSSYFRTHLIELLRNALASVAPDATDVAILIERPKQVGHGDFATNLALQLARHLKAHLEPGTALGLCQPPHKP